MSLGLSGADWQQLSQDYVNSRTYRYRRTNVQNNANNVSSSRGNYAVSENGNICTDGKDDGKIGFFGAIKSIVKGAVKGVVNGIKGCFTNSEGKFSLGKTLLTVATGALCIAFPAVGLAACAIGAVTGGTKLVKGIVNAAQATTDGAKKDALENVGDGALTVGISVLGAKASYNAVVKTAGASSEINAMKSAGTWNDATRLQKLTALGKDMVTSTKNQAGLVKTTALNTKEALEISKLRNKVAKIDKSAMTEKELKLVKELECKTGNLGNQQAIEMANNMPSVKSVLNSAKTKLSEVSLKNIASNIKNLKNNAKFSAIKSALSTKSKAVIEFLTTEEGTYAAAVQKFGYQNVLEALEVFASYRMLDETI